MADSKFEGGSPVTDSNNPYSEHGVFGEERTVLGSLPVEARTGIALDDLTTYSEPITDDAAANRPLHPPTTAQPDAGGAGGGGGGAG
jgi:hypothetical protein